MDNHLLIIYWIFSLFSLLCLLKGDQEPNSISLPCNHGNLDRHGSCTCRPCWRGDKCDIPVNNYAPEFTQDIYEVVVKTLESEGQTLFIPEVIDNDLSETCNGVETNCPCAETHFSIQRGNEDALFTIDPNNGEISLSKGSGLREGQEYMLEISVRNKIRNDIESNAIVVLKINKNGWYNDPINQLADQENNGYSHHRSKRATAAAPQNVTFTLSKSTPYENTAEMWIGSRVKFQLDIMFPVTPTDMLVELFTPDNDTTVMILCDVKVTKGTGLTIDGSTDVTYDSRIPGSSLHDRAIINLGNVTVTNCDIAAECTVIITYDAIMVDDTVQNGSVYWVSAGAEYHYSNEVWVGQASFETITDDKPLPSATDTPTFNFTGVSILPIGSAAIFEVDMFLPYPSTDLTFDAFAPLNTSSVASICSVKVKSIGENFQCGLDETVIASTLYPDSSGLGNSIGHLNIGKVINKASREDPAGDNSSVKVQFVAHLYNNPTFIGNTYWIGAAFEIGSSQIWAGQISVTPYVPVDNTGMSAPTLGDVVSPNNDVDVDVPKVFLYTLQTPELSTSTYDVTFETPVDATSPKFQLCKISIKSVGGNMPCLVIGDKTPIYSSTVGSTYSNKATLSLGSITNLALTPGNATENTITFEIIVTPLQHAAVIANSNHDINMKVRYGIGIDLLHNVQFTVSGTTPAAEISNSTVPTFNMTYVDGNENVNVGASTTVYYDVITNRDVTYPMMNIEAIMPVGNTSAKLTVCRAKLISAGKNLPCVAPEWISDMFTYSSKFNDGKNDRAILSIPKVCNKESEDNTTEDMMRFEFVVKVEDHPDLAHGTKEWISAGNMYSSVKIWVGQLALYAQRPAVISPTTTPYISLNKNTTLSPVPIGMPVVYSLLIKVAPGESIDSTIVVTSSLPGLSVCGLRLKDAGYNYPCVDKTTAPVYDPHASGGNTKATLTMGVITNAGTTPITSNDYFDSNSLIFEVIVQLSRDATLVANSASFPFTVDVTTTTNGSPVTMNNNIVTTYDESGFDTTITASGTFAFSVGEISGNDTEEPVAKGESKRFIVDIVLPVANTQKISVSFLTPVLTTGLIEICDAAIISVGAHFPCLDKKQILPTFQKRTGSLYNDIATIDLGYICSSSVNSSNTADNKIQIEAVARVLPDANLNEGDGVYFHVTVNTNDAQIYVAQINMTVTETFVEKQSPVLLNNDTMLTVNVSTSPVPMKIGEVVTFPLVMMVPPMSSSKVMVDASFPVNETAIATVKDIRLISTGKNIKCLYEDQIKGIAFTPVYNSSLDSCENNKGYLDLGIVTNAGLSYRKDVVESDDDVIYIEVDAVLNDNELTENGATFSFSFGAKLGNFIVLTEQNITVIRLGLEKPVLQVEAVFNETISTSTNLIVDATLYHSNESSAVAVNATVMFYLPPYVNKSSIVANASHTVTEENRVVTIEFSKLLLCDVFSITLILEPDTSVTVPEDISTDATVISYQAGAYMYDVLGSSYATDEYFTTDIQQVNFSTTVVKSGVCGYSLGMEDGRIDDCQILSSVEDDPARPSFHGRVNGSSAWSPFKRGKLFDNLRFFQVYFGNKTLVTKIIVQHKAGFTHYPTKLTLTYSDDGYAWQKGDVVSLTVPFSDSIVYPPRLVESRYFRMYITEDSANGVSPHIGVKFGLFGCYRSNDGPTDICSVAPKRAFPTDYYDRSFGIGNGKLIECDVNPKIDDSPPWCYATTDGTTWKRLSGILGSLLGYDPDESKWFGYASDKTSTVMSTDGGETWVSTSRDTYLLSRDKNTFQFSKRVPWLTDNLDDPSAPHTSYQISNWGATFNGLMQNSLGVWTPKLEWEQCCV